MQNQDFFGFPFENAESEFIKSRWAPRIMDSFLFTSMVLWEISCALAETHIGSENKHAYGKTWSIADERFIGLPLVTHLVAKLIAV